MTSPESVQALYAEMGIRASPSVVLTADNTEKPTDRPNSWLGDDRQYSDEVDHLFGNRPSYYAARKESPTHRMILWLTLRGHKPKEIATALRVTYTTVLRVQKQPWFQDAFCKLSAEIGGDVVRTFLESQVQDTLLKVVDLRDNADSDAVKLAASKEILDRFLGKPVVRTETKEEKTVDMTVTNVTALLAERESLTRQLVANGVLTTQPN